MNKIISIFIFVFSMTFGVIAASAAEMGDIKKQAEPLIQSVVESYNSGIYAKMAINFGEVMFKEFSQGQYDSLRKDTFPLYGYIKKFGFLDTLKQLDYTVVLYKCITDKSEMLIKMAVAVENGRLAIVGLWFT